MESKQGKEMAHVDSLTHVGEQATAPTAPVDSNGGQHSPLPWAWHPNFPHRVIPAADIGKRIGGADDPDVEAVMYAKTILNATNSACDDYPEFHRSRISKAEGLANARLIVRCVNSHDALVDVLRRVRGWDMLDASADGAFWKREIAAALSKAEGK